MHAVVLTGRKYARRLEEALLGAQRGYEMEVHSLREGQWRDVRPWGPWG